MANRSNSPKRDKRGRQANGGNGNSKQGKSRKPREGRRHPVARAIGFTFLVIGGVVVVGIGAGAGYAAALLKGLPTLSMGTLQNISQPTVVYDRNGHVIGKFAADGDRDPIGNVNQVSPFLTHAFVAAEDKTFYTNIGINPLAMVRAFVQDLTHHSIESGASTITQQTVKLAVFPDQQRTLKRKVQEIALALEANRNYSKDEILTDYMNWVYMGRMGNQDIYGVKTASKVLFQKDPSQLNLAEAALLAAIPNNPSLFSPYQNPQNAVKRQHLILAHMLSDGWISQQQYDEALQFDILKDIHKPTTTTVPFPYLMNLDIRPLVDQYLVKAGKYATTQQADEALATAGYKIYTTIDLKDQQDVVNVLHDSQLFGTNTTVRYKEPNGHISTDLYEAGVTLIDNQTGGILAIGGGRDYYKDYYDHSDIPRQPGSSIKPLLDYGPAVQLGKITAATPILDGPISFTNSDGSVWRPTDDVGWWHGIVSARYALAQSLNVPAIQVLHYITPEVGGQYLEKMGITPQSKTILGQPTLTNADLHQLASAIGGMTNGLTVQQVTSAYTTFPNQGVYRPSYLISKITDRYQDVVYQAQPQSTTVFSPQTAYVIDSMLRDVVTSGTATAIAAQFPKNYYIYGKTGTTDSQRDGWFVGYTQKYTMGIWMGYNHNEVIPNSIYNYKFNIWSKIMAPILQQDPPTTPIPEPPGIVQMTVAKDSGQLPSALDKTTGDVYSEIFIQGTEPTSTDDVHVEALYTVYHGKKYLATTNTPPNEVRQGIFLDPSKLTLNLPWPLPAGVTTLDSSQYVPTQPDPRGGQILQTPSSTPMHTLAAPSGLQATVNGDGTVSLQWNPVPSANSYTVWRATQANGPYTNVGGPITDTSFTDSALPQGATTVYYEIYAASDSGVSPPSGVVEVQLSGSPSGGGSGSGNVPQNAPTEGNTLTGEPANSVGNRP
ncbi:MAG: transglycosylase domain-containing protein [Alicyclobacillus sp.]|nr:transglycosylase domain-containing protein [Alicyclobacillus sp.]